MLKKLNKACKFFPCHAGLEDCTFCYCPFYPCLDERLGKYVYSSKQGKGIWSCQSCSWIHKNKVTAEIFTLIVKNKSLIKKEQFPPKFVIHNLKNAKLGIIILSHGCRLRKANASLEKIVKATKKNTGLGIVVPAYLQLSHPNLTESVKSLIGQECGTIIIIPFFLFNGNHVTRDIPRIIKEEKAKYPKTRFIYSKNIGDDSRIADIVADTVEGAMQSENNY
jgi:Zn-finger protein